LKVQPLPKSLVKRWAAEDGRYRIEVFPHEDLNDDSALRHFVSAVRTVAPETTGFPAILLEAGNAVITAFKQASLGSLIAIIILRRKQLLSHISTIPYVAIQELVDLINSYSNISSQNLQKEITRFVKSYPEKTSTATRWKKPLVGFASVDDPLFPRLKAWVRPSHALPQDLLPTGKTVIAYFLPFENKVQKENAQKGLHPSRSWAVAYIETNRLIRDLGDHLKNFLEEEGYRTFWSCPRLTES
jgi:hypothetical protein